ncbi:protein kinase family protein [Kitasatospora sp. GP82]|uniref:protein kinase family protein n=1 Tax=Kitasatospora sp. GP82 TaxID=3035089 RepID=UPI002473A581|nr:protein kinase family protein [Kitasatospora sp. GP82]MDH6127662.1 serine/threonine protein kinase [Kitasatospora sp. GP82]
MADGTKAVVDTSVADEAALAMALGDIPGDTPDEQSGDAPDDTPAASVDAPVRKAAKGSESAKGTKGKGTKGTKESVAEAAEPTAPLSSAEIAAELAAGAAALAAAAKQSAEQMTAAPKKTAAPAETSAPAKSAEPAPGPAAAAKSPAVSDAGNGSLPSTLPAPLRHSGDKIADRYRLEECIGQSAAFSSWRAVDEKLRRAVGVHLLAAGHQRAKDVLAAAKSAALLGDPRFVQVLDAVQEGELVYVIREWLPDATDLAQLLAAGPMEPYDAYQMVRQVTDAIAAAHRRGQAHLRLTPRCVLRTESGQYRINGIAVDAALRGLSAEDSELTDTRSIGALLYAALTHRWPYPEDRYDLQGLPKGLGCVPPDQVKAGVHKGLSELAARALCEQLPHSLEPITSPEQLAKAVALTPKIRQPEPPAPPAFTPPRYNAPRPAQPNGGQGRPGQPPVGQPPGGHQHAVRHAPPPARRSRMRTLVKWTASLVALAAIGVASWQLVSSLNSTTDTGDKGSVTTSPKAGQSPSAPPVVSSGNPITIKNAYQFNVFGTGPEHEETAGNAIDNNPATTWSTSSYNANFPSLKPGTGLMIDLGSAQKVTSVHVKFAGGDTTAELRAAPKDTSDTPSATKSGFDLFGAALISASGSEVDLRPQQPLTARYLLIWLTSIPKDGDQYRGQIAEINVTG